MCGNTNEVNIAAEEETTQWHHMWVHYELDMKLLLIKKNIKKLGVGILKNAPVLLFMKTSSKAIGRCTIEIED